MQIKTKTKTIIITILVTFLIGFTATFIWGYRKGHQRGDNASQLSIDSLNNQIHAYKIELDKKQLYIYEARQEIKTLKEAKRDGQVRNKDLIALGLKKDVEVTRLKARVDTLISHIQHNGLIVITDTVETMPRNAIVLPFIFEHKDQWLTLTGLFDEKGTLGISTSMELNLDLYTGIDRKTKGHVIKLVTDNPYIKNIGLNSYRTDYKPPTKNGIGVQIGYGVGIVNSKPQTFVYVGLGFSRNFIRW